MRPAHAQPRCLTPRSKKAVVTQQRPPATVFDVLYDGYLPFRLYADYMLGTTKATLAKEFAVSEHWVSERIDAMRLCIEKQIRLNLLDNASVAGSFRTAS